MPPGPDEKCDPACQKIIINSGLMAIAIDQILDMNGLTREMADAAKHLRNALTAHLAAYDALTKIGAVTLTKEKHAFRGCDEASEIMSWVLALDGGLSIMPAATAATKRMYAWASEQLQHTAKLIGGGRRAE